MEFKFVGNPNDPLDNKGEVTLYGVRFPLNIPVRVDNPVAIKKLMGNGHFVMVDGGKTHHQVKKLIVTDEPALVVPGLVAKPKRVRKTAEATA